jgi:zinc protease
MKRLFFIRKGLLVGYLLYFAVSVFSQQTEKFVIDPKVRHGKLDNGLTYYIRHNEMPKERAEFYIVQNVGSMQEEDNQRGLAHFLEHMAFNGTKHFPSKKGIQDYTESIGMQMGENLNAYTGFDETVYMLMNVPVTRTGVVDSCLLILHDWSSFLLLEDDAIEKERGVIREEWRTNRTAQLRLWEQQLPQMYPNSRYGHRLPIGDIHIINNFKADELHTYYKKWYRPDLQAIIIVGDIDVDRVEGKIKTLFADIPAPVNPAPREKSLVADNATPLISIAKDKEASRMELSLYYKHEIVPDAFKGTIVDFITNYTKAVISMTMKERLAEILQKPDPPFISADAGDDDYFISPAKGAWTSTAVVKPNELKRAMRALVEETERVRKHGITEAEYERARENILKIYESAYNEREKQENSLYAQECARHFTDNEYMPGIEAEYELVTQIAPILPVKGINQYIDELFKESERGKNLVISLSGPDKEDLIYPTENELFEMYVSAFENKVEAKEEEVVSKILIPQLPQPGKIVEERDDPLFDTKLFTLSNGARVVVRQTDFKADEILMTATSPGGTTQFPDEKDIWNLKVINIANMLGGLGEFSATKLKKAIAGKHVELSAGLEEATENFNGSVSPSDLKTMFELIYLQFTAVRTDDAAYASFEERVKQELHTLYLDPSTAFSDSLTDLIYNRNPRNSRLKASDFDRIDYHRMIEMYKERYADASDFIFTFVGNVNLDSIRPLMEQYLASLPSLGRKEKPDEKQVTPFRKGKVSCHFTKKLETPISTVGLMYTGEMPYNLKNVVTTLLLSQILDLAYMQKIREEKSASYGVQNHIYVTDFPEGRSSIQIYFDTNPEQQDEIIQTVKSELEQIASNGPQPHELEVARRTILKGRVEMKHRNDYWLNIISAYYYRNFDGHTEYENILTNLTGKDVQSFAKQLLDQGNEIEVVMSSE